MIKAEDCHGIQPIDSEELRERRLSMIERAQKEAKKADQILDINTEE
jgi:hypothetical protein